MLFGAGDAMTVDGIMAALSNLGGLGILAMVLFYLHTSSLKQHHEEITAERRSTREELNAERLAWGARFDRLHEDHGKLSDRIDDGFEAVAKQLSDIRRGRHIQASDEFEERTAKQERRPKGGRGENPTG